MFPARTMGNRDIYDPLRVVFYPPAARGEKAAKSAGLESFPECFLCVPCSQMTRRGNLVLWNSNEFHAVVHFS
jgi:hypothetical protein